MVPNHAGRKDVFVYPPTDFSAFYPFPVNHACDRQSMVNVDNPDLDVRCRMSCKTFQPTHWRPVAIVPALSQPQIRKTTLGNVGGRRHYVSQRNSDSVHTVDVYLLNAMSWKSCRYLPGHWWHHFRNRDQHAMSITFWSKQKPFNLYDSVSVPCVVSPRHFHFACVVVCESGTQGFFLHPTARKAAILCASQRREFDPRRVWHRKPRSNPEWNSQYVAERK